MQLQARERPAPGFDTLVSGSLAVDRLLEDGDVFDLGCGLRLQVFHTPGHSRGSISLLLLGYQALFPGDASPIVARFVAAHLGLRDQEKIIQEVSCPPSNGFSAGGGGGCDGGHVALADPGLS